jgi:phage/plasmid-like protein (TIGR03299 family)
MAWVAGEDKLATVEGSERSWHGNENIVKKGATLETWKKESGLDFRVIKANIVHKFLDEATGQVIEIVDDSRYSFLRDDNHMRLGIFSDQYHAVQPTRIVEFMNEFFMIDPRFELATMGSLKGGRVIWAQARFESDTDIIGAKHIPYAFVATSFDGTMATTASASFIRAVCRNTVRIAANEESGIKIRHRTDFTIEKQSQAVEVFANVISGFSQFKEMAEAMHKIKLSYDKTAQLFAHLLGADKEEASKRKQNQVDAMLDAYRLTQREPGTDEHTGWAAFNAVTRFVDHNRTTRKTVDGESEFSARLYAANFGSGLALKNLAASKILEAA